MLHTNTILIDDNGHVDTKQLLLLTSLLDEYSRTKLIGSDGRVQKNEDVYISDNGKIGSAYELVDYGRESGSRRVSSRDEGSASVLP